MSNLSLTQLNLKTGDVITETKTAIIDNNFSAIQTNVNNNSNKIGDLIGSGLTETDLASAIKNDRSQLSDMVQQTLAKLVQDMRSGQSVTIACYGDSTYYGYLNSGSRASVPAPAQLQILLRSYYKNNNISVINNGISGNQTTNALRTWDSDMQNTTGQIIYINYGINDMEGGNPSGVSDPALTAEQFRQNLRTMVSIARKYNKIVILETPNPLTYDSADGFGSAEWKVEGVKQFASVTRQVAKELNVPLVDSFSDYIKYIRGLGNIYEPFQQGGVHPTEAGYIVKGTNMTSPLIAPDIPVIHSECIVPVGGGETIATSPKTVVSSGSNSGYCIISDTSIRIAFYVDTPGLDIYISTPIWDTGANSLAVKVDGNQVFTANLNDSSLSGQTIAIDQELLVMQNANLGLHIIELVGGGSSSQVALYYLRAYQSHNEKILGDGSTNIGKLIAYDLDVTMNNASGFNHLLLDTPTTRTLKNLDIAFNAQLAKNTGIFLFGTKIGIDGSYSPHGGLYFYLDDSGHLNVNEGSGYSGYLTGIPIINSSDLSNASHTYRITVTTAGLVTVYLDGVAQTTTYNITKPRYGGFFGIWTANVTNVHFNWIKVFS